MSPTPKLVISIIIFAQALSIWAKSSLGKMEVTATPADQIHFEKYQALVPHLTEGKMTLPPFKVCLRNYLAPEQCLTGHRPFFTCENPDINKYLSCITDPGLAKKIAEANDRMYLDARKETVRLENDQKLDPSIKKENLKRLRASIEEYDKVGQEIRLRRIEEVVNGSKRFEVAKLLKSPDFLGKVEKICESHPDACMSEEQYKDHGNKLLKNFEAEFNKQNSLMRKRIGSSLDEALKDELLTINTCKAEMLSNDPSSSCKKFKPDAEIIGAVTTEMKKGTCRFLNEARRRGGKLHQRLELICVDYYNYIMESKGTNKPAPSPFSSGSPETAVTPASPSTSPSGDKEGSLNGKSNGSNSSNGWKGGTKEGTTTNHGGLFFDIYSGHIKEEKYTCDKLESVVTPADCEVGAGEVVDKEVMDLAEHAQEASKECTKEVRPSDYAMLDAASSKVETMFRTYVDRLNVDGKLSSEQYQMHMDQLVSSCQAPPSQKNECDYGEFLKRETGEYVKELAAQALIQKQKMGERGNKLGDDYLEDVVKAGQDLKEIEQTLKDLLVNFPSPEGSLKDIWPEFFPCQSVVGLIDDIKSAWNDRHYNSLCPKLEIVKNQTVLKEEEALYQRYKMVELGLSKDKSGKAMTLKDYRQDEVAEYQKLKAEIGMDNGINDVKGLESLYKDKRYSSMLAGTLSPTGRVLVEESTLLGVESRRLECQKKADQVGKLINMKMSLLANYPQLAAETFSDGIRPSKEWKFWKENCQDGKREVRVCKGPLPSSCKMTVRSGCEKEPSDWKKGKPQPLYKHLAQDKADEYGKKIGKQLDVGQSENDLDSLRKSVGKICNDPLKAGKEVIQDDKLYTLHATCALQKVQNGERRGEGDVDKYQFWKPMNQSATSKKLCARRATESRDRCFIVNELNSGLKHALLSGASEAAGPIMQGLDYVGCMAMFVGAGGAFSSARVAVNELAKGTLKAKVKVALKAGAKHLKDVLVDGVKGMATPLGAAFSGGAMALAYHQAQVAEENYQKVEAKFLTGLASEEELKRAREEYEAASMVRNLKMMLAGMIVPSGGKHMDGPEMPHQPHLTKSEPHVTGRKTKSPRDESVIELGVGDLEEIPDLDPKDLVPLMPPVPKRGLPPKNVAEAPKLKPGEDLIELDPDFNKPIELSDGDLEEIPDLDPKDLIPDETPVPRGEATVRNAAGRPELKPGEDLIELDPDFEVIRASGPHVSRATPPVTPLEDWDEVIKDAIASVKGQDIGPQVPAPANNPQLDDVLESLEKNQDPVAKASARSKRPGAEVKGEGSSITHRVKVESPSEARPTTSPIDNAQDPGISTGVTRPSGNRSPRSNQSNGDANPLRDTIRITQANGEDVVASLGRCCTGKLGSMAGDEGRLSQSISNAEGSPYFIGRPRDPNYPTLRMEPEVAGNGIKDRIKNRLKTSRIGRWFEERQGKSGYQWEAPEGPLKIDFNEMYPGLDEVSLHSLKMDQSGNLTEAGVLDAIDYIRKKYPKADQYNIEFLAQGGFNTVFKLCPKGGGRCKVLKLPGFDRNSLIVVQEGTVKLKELDKKILEANARVERAASPQEKMRAQINLKNLSKERSDLQKAVTENKAEIAQAIKSYRMDLALTGLSENAFAPGRGPRLDGEEVLVHGSINKDPALLKEGIVEMDYYGAVGVEQLNKYQDEFKKITDAIIKEDKRIIEHFSDPRSLTMDATTLLEFGTLCSKAALKVVQGYCGAFWKANGLPSLEKMKDMLKATLMMYQKAHTPVGQAMVENFGVMRDNPVRVIDPVIGSNGKLEGKMRREVIGFDPLGGKNIMWDSETKRFVSVDR